MNNSSQKPSLELLAYQQQEISKQLNSFEAKLDEMASHGSSNFQAYETRAEGKFATKQELVINQQTIASQISLLSEKLSAQVSLLDTKIESVISGQKPYQAIFYDVVRYLVVLAIGGGLAFAFLHK